MLQRLSEYFETPRKRWTAGSAAGIIAAGAVAIVVWASWPTSKPDVWDDGLDDVAGFFFDKNFNNLPVEERLEMLQEFVARFRDGGQEEAVILAMFLSDVTYDMRQQVEDNMFRLGVDMWTEWGREYEDVAPQNRAAYLDNLVAEMDRLGDRFNGRTSDRDNTDRVESAQRRAQRDRERAQEWTDNKPPDRDTVTGFLGIYSSEFATRAAPQERARVMKLSRDLTRHLRGESLENDGDDG